MMTRKVTTSSPLGMVMERTPDNRPRNSTSLVVEDDGGTSRDRVGDGGDDVATAGSLPRVVDRQSEESARDCLGEGPDWGQRTIGTSVDRARSSA